MAKPEDEVSASISVVLDKVAGTADLSIAVKSRFVAAVDRMSGGIFDWGGSWFDTKIERRKHEEKLRQDFREFQQQRVKEFVLHGNSEQLHRLKLVSEYSSFDRLLNYKAVVEEAADLISENAELYSQIPDTAAIDNDWMNRFKMSAEAASSEQLRNLWARILAGESRQPGSFSASALRFVAELDKSLGESCERIAKYVFFDAIVLRPELKQGQYLLDLLALQSQGLLAGASGGLSKTFEADEQGQVLVGNAPLLLRIKGAPSASHVLDNVILTNVGKEVFSLLQPPPYEENLRYIASQLQPSVDSIDLVTVTPLSAGEFSIITSQNIYQKPV